MWKLHSGESLELVTDNIPNQSSFKFFICKQTFLTSFLCLIMTAIFLIVHVHFVRLRWQVDWRFYFKQIKQNYILQSANTNICHKTKCIAKVFGQDCIFIFGSKEKITHIDHFNKNIEVILLKCFLQLWKSSNF